ncbi:MAG: Xaa-Pro peptidase family protein [Gammaproteobacteria bacterium]|nr:Xaa-Pro peptidase family protein [Gammaproteobacteria bacterium]MDH3464929.1 Xaa-Pro peptidase family protein [Gammaproteobacteria bacterium]
MKANFEAALDAAWQHREIPFPLEEYGRRLSRIRRQMEKSGIELLFLTSPESLFYVSGFQCEWYQAQSGRAFPPTSGIAVHVDRDDYIHFETPSEAMLVAIGTVSKDVRIFPIESRRDGIPFILTELKSEGWLKGKVGLELRNYRPNPVVSGQYREGFEAAGMTVLDGTDIVREIRRRKSALEMDCILAAAGIADIGMAAAKEAIQPGAMELEVFGEFTSAMAKAGGEFPAILPPVMSGFRSNCLHPLSSRRKIRMGERVNIDLCGVFNRYHCNIARSFWMGEPPAEAAILHEKSIRAFEIIQSLLKPGLSVKQLLEAVRDYYVEAGIYDDCYWSGGYELGIAFPPDWVGAYIYDLTMAKEDDIFEPMTVVNHECNFFAPNGTGLSATIETLIFQQDHAHFACTTSRDLQILFA